MNEADRSCRQCGCPIMQRTFDRNEGLCVRCRRRSDHPPNNDIINLVLNPPTITRTMLDDLIVSADSHAVIDALWFPAAKRLRENPSDPSEADLIVYTAWTFVGEVENGGIIQYLDNNSGQWAHRCGDSLRAIGADDYAEKIEGCIRAFTDAESRDDPKWEADLKRYRKSSPEATDFHEVRVVWKSNREMKDVVPELLFDYICENRDLFAPYRTDDED